MFIKRAIHAVSWTLIHLLWQGAFLAPQVNDSFGEAFQNDPSYNSDVAAVVPQRQAIEQLLDSLEEIAGPDQFKKWRSQLNAVQSPMVAAPPAPSAQKPNIATAEPSEDQRTTRRLFDQYINRAGKIPTDEVRAAIELVAARGQGDRNFQADVLGEFEKRCDGKGQRIIKKNLLAVISKWLEVEGGYRWNHESSLDQATQQVSTPSDAKSLYANSPLLERIITRGYEADRFDVASFIFAIRLAHHPQGKSFLLDVLNERVSKVSPFTSPTHNPVGKWQDISAIDDDERFIAAVGLAELGQAEGVGWLITHAQPSDFGDGTLNFAHHWTLRSGSAGSSSLRLNCRAALADLSGLKADIEPIQWKKWWATQKTSFQPKGVNLRRVFDP